MNAISQHRALQMDNFLEFEFSGISSDNLWHHWMLLDRSRFLLFLLRSASAHSPPPVQNISPKIKCYSHESTTSICCWREKHIIPLAKLHTSKHKHTHNSKCRHNHISIDWLYYCCNHNPSGCPFKFTQISTFLQFSPNPSSITKKQEHLSVLHSGHTSCKPL